MTRRREEKGGSNFISVRARWERFKDTDEAIGGDGCFERNKESERRTERKGLRRNRKSRRAFLFGISRVAGRSA